jgi:hypothetical protein
MERQRETEVYTVEMLYYLIYQSTAIDDLPIYIK